MFQALTVALWLQIVHKQYYYAISNVFEAVLAERFIPYLRGAPYFCEFRSRPNFVVYHRWTGHRLHRRGYS